MIKYIITGINDDGERLNIFKDSRHYSSKKICMRAIRKVREVFNYDAFIECNPIEIETSEELIEKLKSELKIEREAVDFYADTSNYQRGEMFFQSVLTGDHGDIEKFDDIRNCYFQISGRLAREIKAKRVLALE